MFDNWLESMKTMGIFLVCAQALIHFKPKGVYEKYIRLLVSVMLLVQLLEPVGNMLGFLQKGELQQRILNMERRLEYVQRQTYEVEAEAENIWSMLLQDIAWDTEDGETQEAEPEAQEAGQGIQEAEQGIQEAEQGIQEAGQGIQEAEPGIQEAEQGIQEAAPGNQETQPES